MSIFDKIGRMLEVQGNLAASDAIVVLDGGEFNLRLAAGLDLLRRGHAPRLIVCLSDYHRAQHRQAEQAALEWPNVITLLRSPAVSTKEEAAEVGPVLKRLRCRGVLIVTSWYHTRRAQTIFARELKKDEIEVGVYPVAVPTAPRGSWWKSSEGREIVVLETIKLFSTWLRVGLPGPPDLRIRLKEWIQSAPTRPQGQLVPAWNGPQERLTADLQAYLRHVQVRRGEYLRSDSTGVAVAPKQSLAGSSGALRWVAPNSTENGADEMEEKSFKAITVTAKEGAGHAALAEAFNTWAEKERPASVVHVHYYHDQRTRMRGYQIIFEESIRAEERREPSTEERRAA